MRSRSISKLLLLLTTITLIPLQLHGQDEKVTFAEWHYLFNNQQIRRELEITNAQVRELHQRLRIIEKNDASYGPADPIQHFFLMQRFKAGQELSSAERLQIDENQNRIQEGNEKRDAEINSAAQEILLPFQIERLRQLTCWQIIYEQGYAAFLQWKPINVILDINQQQSSEIDELANKLKLEFERDLSELQAKYREKLNQVLTAKQIHNVEDLLGKNPNLFKNERPRF